MHLIRQICLGLVGLLIVPSTFAQFGAGGSITLNRGSAPANPVDYQGLRALNCTPTEQKTVTTPAETAGTFQCESTDPYAPDGDDGALVLASNNGNWWVRQFSHNAASPIEAGWWEYTDNTDITADLNDLWTDVGSSTDLFWRSSADTLIINQITWSAIDSLYLLEPSSGNAVIKLSDTPTSTNTMFDLGAINVFVLGTTDERTYANYSFGNKLQFHGNTEGAIGTGQTGRQGLFEWTSEADDLKGVVHADFYWTRASGVVRDGGTVAAGTDSIFVRGVFHQSGMQLDDGWEYLFTDVRVTDPKGRGPGWDGTANADNCDYTTYGGGKNYYMTPAVGESNSELHGHWRFVYGGAGTWISGARTVGTDTNNRFIIEMDSLGYTDTGQQISVFNDCGVLILPGKADNWGGTTYGTKFVDIRLGGPWADFDGIWWEQQACDIGAPDTRHTDYVFSTKADFSPNWTSNHGTIHIGRQSATCTGTDINWDHKIRGSNSAEPGDWTEGIRLRISKGDTVFSGYWEAIDINTSIDNASFPDPDDVRVQSVTVEERIFIDALADNFSMGTVTMPSTATIVVQNSFTCDGSGTITTTGDDNSDGTYEMSNANDRTTLGATGAGPYTICNP